MGLTIQEVRDRVRKKYGDGAAFIGSDNKTQRAEVISTGSLRLDDALGVGGLPKGRIVEIFGPESSGKTTLCQHVIAQIQQMGGIAAFVDVEHALDLEYAIKCGVVEDQLLISQPDHGEQALEITESYVRDGVPVVIVDSVAALVPKAEIEGEMGDSHMGLQARLMSQALRKLNGPVKENKTLLIFTNQLRHKIGVMFGSPETTTGGMALRFYASVRIDLRKRQIEKDGEIAVGNTVQATIKKNKVAPPFRKTEFDIAYSEGILKLSEILYFINLGKIDENLIKKAGAWYTVFFDESGVAYDEPLKFNGEKKLKQYLIENPNYIYHLENIVRKNLGLPLISLEN